MAKQAIMKVWNVELGLAVHIKAPNGKYIVIDLGATNDFSPLLTLRNKEVGYMVITHPHKDHIDDISYINYAKPHVLWRVNSFSRKELLEGAKTQADRDIFNKYCDFEESYTGTVSERNDPSSINPFDGLTAKVFATTECGKSNINNFSAIVVVDFSNIKIVICGDNERASFNKLMESMEFQSAITGADILIAAHHGRASGYHTDFVDMVNPKLTIVSDTQDSDTTASDRYSKKSSGWNVFDRDGKSEMRKCLTTRKDGNIEVTFGELNKSNQVLLHVKKGM